MPQFWIMNVDGSKNRFLVNSASPDGSYISYIGYVFTDDTYIERKLYYMHRDGSIRRKSPAISIAH